MVKKIVCVLLTAIIVLQTAGCADIRTTVLDKISEETQKDTSKENTSQETTDKADIRYQDDYYEYVNSNLLDKIQLSDTDAQWTWFGELSAVANEEMEDIIREVASSNEAYPKGSSEQKIRDMYECVSNMENRNEVGLGPLQPHLELIRNAATVDEYVDALAKLSGEFGFSSIVGGYYIDQDKADSSKYAVYLLYADTLIGKEYLESDSSQDYVNMYFDYVSDMFEEFGMSGQEAEQTSEDIEALLRDICASTLPSEQYYDPAVTYNVYTKEELQQLYTNIDVNKMLETLRIDSVDTYIVEDVEQAQKINSLLTEENLEVLKNFSTFVMLNDAAEYSTQNYTNLKEQIDNQLHGVTASRGDEYIWMSLTQDMLPWDFGKIYVEEHFSEQSKQDVEAIIDRIIAEYEQIINRQEWMSDATKQKAIRKLETMSVKIGYPDEWPESMDMMQVTPISEGGSLLSNMLVNMQVSIEDSLQKLGDEVDRSLWGMTPQTINAYYDPANNEIVFPAAILQSPFYNPDAEDAVNIGAIGFVIAHEISHAFDANGSKYDEYGNYNEWWTQEETQKYNELSQSIIDYYSKYEIMGVPVNGSLTLSENIADLGAMTCVTSIIGDNNKALDAAFGQFAYIWASVETAGYQMYLLNNDTHSPNKLRVNAVLGSCDAFYQVYDIARTDGMYIAPEDRVGIWK